MSLEGLAERYVRWTFSHRWGATLLWFAMTVALFVVLWVLWSLAVAVVVLVVALLFQGFMFFSIWNTQRSARPGS